ncbi:ATP-binding protein [Corynebacterium aurimucosum]|uniref:AAA family ATPase n=1 Tax=Corynebacterium guaraldiae TaxID=3051103 RepID=A0ABY3CTF4_9CORY|nr:ATP-binding protein [Corynebacterium guaraldiae]MTE09510.1 ATP-binding protein [Corynebacterium guaraldiae]TRX48738.1 AAA family ATPase [Corynebacterium guaraldiae]TRX51706.1 AAA family ATPase [Corynebacterium guaraldiae]
MMQLHSVELNNVRGVDHLEVKDLPETGVVVIGGPNEAGKSTLVESIDFVLTQKHTANSKAVRALQPAGRDVGPEVTLEATVGPYHFRIHKRWVKKRTSELHVFSPRPGQWTGAEADGELERILSEHMDRALVDALFVRQNDSHEGIAAVGIPSLTAALEEQTGANAVAEDSELLTRIEAEYKEYFTAKTDKPAGDYKAAIATLSEAEEERAKAESALRELDGVVERYEAAELKKAEAEAALPEAVEECERRDGELVAARAAQEKVTAQEAAVTRAAEAVTRAEEESARRKAVIAEHSAAVEAAERAATAVSEARERAEEESAARTKLEEERAEVHTRYEAVREERQHARRAQRRAEREALGTRLEALTKLEETLASRRRELAAAPDVPNLKALEDAAREVTVQERLRAAAAAKLYFSGKGSVAVDGEERSLESGEELAVELREGTTLQVGEVTARYAAGAGESGEEGVEKARAELARLLEDAGCEDLESARAAHEKHTELASTADSAARELAAALGGEDLGELRARFEASAEEAEDVEGAEEAAEPRELDVVEQEEEELRRKLDELDRAVAPYRENKAGAALEVATVRAEEAIAQRDAKAAAVEAARAQLSDADVTTAIEVAQAKLQEEREVLAEMSAVDVDTAEHLAKGARTHVDSLKAAVNAAVGDMREFRGLIDMHSGAAEDAEKAAAELEVARERHAAIERRANAARYLRTLMLRHRDAARQRYAAPFVTALNSLARTVFGGDVDFELSEELKVEARSRDGETVSFDALSGGAKEQLSILTRFAIAQLVSDEPVPVLIDDALGSTDSQRLQLMAALFSKAGKSTQVIVLTCMPQRYSWVPGRMELDMEKLTRA